MKIQKHLLSAVFIFLSYSGFSQTWIYVTASNDGDKYYVRSSAVSTTETKKVWTKQTSSRLTYFKAGRTRIIKGSVISLREFDCDGKQIKTLSSVYYDLAGNVVNSYQPQDYEVEWNNVVPDSIGEILLNKVCELF